jgi:hypothetical protein
VNTPFEIDDETLMAYADGELDAAQAAQVEQLLQQDASAAARVAQHQALRAQLRSGSAAVLSEPVPERLLSMLQRNVDDSRAGDKVVDFSRTKQRKANTTRIWSGREWGAMAASLIAGVVLGIYALTFSSTNLVGDQGGRLVAQGKLNSALTTQLASAGHTQSIQIGISFRNHAGEYCRSFSIQDTHALAGLACRTQGNWRVQMLTESVANNSSELRQAGSATPAAILSLIDEQIAGEPLDADAEAAARHKGWQ